MPERRSRVGRRSTGVPALRTDTRNYAPVVRLHARAALNQHLGVLALSAERRIQLAELQLAELQLASTQDASFPAKTLAAGSLEPNYTNQRCSTAFKCLQFPDLRTYYSLTRRIGAFFS